MISATDRPRADFQTELTLTSARPLVPVKWWAAVGGFFVAFELYLIGRWVTSGNFTPVSSGPDTVPTYMLLAVRAHEVLGVGSFVLCIYFFVIRPWRKERRVPMSGLLCLASLTIFWQDTALNWGAHGVVWNSAFVNFGSWYNFIPGWISPRANHIPQPLLFDPLIYPLFFAIPVLFIAWCMRKAKQRFPTWGIVRLSAVALLVAGTIDVCVEVAWLVLGVYSYAGVKPLFTLFPGHYYQFPLYEALLWGAAWAAPAVLVYCRDDRGNTAVERGITTMQLSAGRAVVIRVLALGAFLNIAFLAYNGAFGLMHLQPGYTWAQDAVDRSYLRGELCGPGTTYACPGADLPVPRGDNGSHVDENGELVVPPGAASNRYK